MSPPLPIAVCFGKMGTRWSFLLPLLVLSEVKEAKHWWGEHLLAERAQRDTLYPSCSYSSESPWYNADTVRRAQSDV